MARRVALALDIQLLYKHHTEVFAGVQRYADEAGWLTIIDNWCVGALARSTKAHPAFDGVIARVGPERAGLIRETAKRNVPLVNVQFGSPFVNQLPGVFPDYALIGRIQAEHLLALGLKHFAFMANEERMPDARQATAFATAIEAAGYSVTRLDLPAAWDDAPDLNRQCVGKIEQWMNAWKRPIGVACSVDDCARRIAQDTHTRGWRVPEDVAIIGSRNEEHLCGKPRPTLSSIEIGYDRIGYEAARLLDGLMDEADRRRQGGTTRKRGRKKGSSSDPLHVILPPVGVVVRESTDAFVADDPLVAEAQALIKEKCHQPLGVSDLATMLVVSPRTLQNHFTAAINRSVAEEIRRVRLERAKRDLADSTLSIHDVARRAGFTSNARLCEVFQREVGMSPTAYREQRTMPRRG